MCITLDTSSPDMVNVMDGIDGDGDVVMDGYSECFRKRFYKLLI